MTFPPFGNREDQTVTPPVEEAGQPEAVQEEGEEEESRIGKFIPGVQELAVQER